MESMEINSDSNCVNCCLTFDSAESKCTKINIALPIDSVLSGGQHVQSIQILEISVRDILLEIYGFDFSLQSEDGQRLSVCSACSFNLANLYLAHRNFVQTRHVNSLLSEALTRIREILLEWREDEKCFSIVKEEACDEVVEEGINNNIEMVADCSREDIELPAVESSDNGGIILSIVPIPTKQLTESPKNILNPAVDDQVIVIDVPHIPVEEPNEIYYGGVGVQPQNKTGEFVLPTPRPGVKVSVLNSSSIRCPFTKKISKTSSSYRHHMLSHQTDREASANFLPCASCNLEFQSLEHLQQHRILIHEYTGSGRGIFSSKDIPVSVKNSRGSVSFTVRLEPGLCQFPGCHFLAVTKEEAVDHYISLHSRCEDDIDQARHLGLGLIQFDVQEDNISPEIISRFMPTGSPPYNCEFCDFSARELDFLKNHLKSRHLSVIQSFEERQNVNVDRVDPAATDAIKSPKDPTPPSFSIIFPEQTFEFTLPDNQCPYCRKCVMCKGSWNPMKVHIREMHLWPLTGKKFKCSKCPRVFERRYVAKAHTQRCGQPDLRKMKKKGRVKTHCCEKCGKSFINAGCLKNHLDSRCGRVFSCEVCGLNFNKNFKLVSHKVSHATERPFFCEHCGRNYKSRHALTFHQKISHTDEGRLKYNEMMRMKNRRRKLAQYQNAKDLKKQ